MLELNRKTLGPSNASRIDTFAIIKQSAEKDSLHAIIHLSFQAEREPEIVTTLVTRLRQQSYGHFSLTGAIRPSPDVPIVPSEGYRMERFRDRVSRQRIPMLAASVSSEHLFEVFVDLLKPLGETVDVVLETSHDFANDCHQDLHRGEIDLPVLASHLYDYEELLLNDGCSGVAVLAQGRPIEVQFDEHKLLYVYAHDLKPFRRILRWHGVRRRDDMQLIAESEHLHHSAPHYADEFQQLCSRIGAGRAESALSDENGWSAW